MYLLFASFLGLLAASAKSSLLATSANLSTGCMPFGDSTIDRAVSKSTDNRDQNRKFTFCRLALGMSICFIPGCFGFVSLLEAWAKFGSGCSHKRPTS